LRPTTPRADLGASPWSESATVPWIDALVRRALAEDGGAGEAAWPGRDLTSEVLSQDAAARARLVAKEAGVLAGLLPFERVFRLLDPGVTFEALAQDGERLTPGREVARLAGRARALLFGERTALNFVQHLSGVATLTARYVERCAGRAQVLDTRKTTPGLRLLEKHAVRCGGGVNHRLGLWDEVMVKNNHVDLAGTDLATLVARLRERVGEGVRITAEERDEAEALAGVRGGADVILLDNFTPERLRAACTRVRAAARSRARPLLLEASGGIDLETIEGFAASGVDRLSIGALTHSAPALDLSLYMEPGP
jgi:nicotinate-nucleotide pyrophosphorylase (carboxylating)